MTLARVLLASLVLALAGTFALAQTGLPDALKNRPPVAAPTSAIEVAPIEVVRSASEAIGDFGGGLLQGLMARHGVTGAALVAAQDSRIIVNRTFGARAGFGGVERSDFLAPLAVMQLVERQTIKLEDAVPGAAGVTVGQVLTHQADPSALRRMVETASGQDFGAHVAANILSPLGAGVDDVGSMLQGMGRLLVALLNEGAFDAGRLLEPASVEAMEQQQFSVHPMLPGWTYGFAEMRRNGWRALQRDGIWSDAPMAEARMVIVPGANLAYFVIVEGQAGAAFWRAFDDALFDRILPPRDSAASEPPSVPAPDAAAARAVAGSYEASTEPLSQAAPLKSAGRFLTVRAEGDGSLVLVGAENAVLAPRPGGYWSGEGGNLDAAINNGRLVLSTGLFVPLSLWKRPALYASLALFFSLGAVGAFARERRASKPSKTLGRVTAALTCATGALLLAALFVWHLFPVL